MSHYQSEISPEILDAPFQDKSRTSGYSPEELWYLKHDLETALLAVRDAAAYLLRRFRMPHHIENKPDGTIVLQEDFVAQEMALSYIRSRRVTQDGIIAEEGVSEGLENRRRWYVDACDGTKRYSEGGHEFASAVALEEDGELKIGAISLPFGKPLMPHERSTQTLVYAVSGLGAFMDGRPIRAKRRDTLSDTKGVTHRWVIQYLEERRRASYPKPGEISRIDECAEFVTTGFQDQRELEYLYNRWEEETGTACDVGGNFTREESERLARLLYHGPKCFPCGSVSFHQAKIAQGELDWYLSLTLKPWDAAPGKIIIQESGGQVTSEGFFLATARGNIHQEFIRLLQLIHE